MADTSLLTATRSVLAQREAELLALKGPCSNGRCRLHYAHSGPCQEAAPHEDEHGAPGSPERAAYIAGWDGGVKFALATAAPAVERDDEEPLTLGGIYDTLRGLMERGAHPGAIDWVLHQRIDWGDEGHVEGNHL